MGAAFALDHSEDPMTLKLENAGESHSHMLPLVPDNCSLSHLMFAVAAVHIAA